MGVAAGENGGDGCGIAKVGEWALQPVLCSCRPGDGQWPRIGVSTRAVGLLTRVTGGAGEGLRDWRRRRSPCGCTNRRAESEVAWVRRTRCTVRLHGKNVGTLLHKPRRLWKLRDPGTPPQPCPSSIPCARMSQVAATCKDWTRAFEGKGCCCLISVSWGQRWVQEKKDKLSPGLMSGLISEVHLSI